MLIINAKSTCFPFSKPRQNLAPWGVRFRLMRAPGTRPIDRLHPGCRHPHPSRVMRRMVGDSDRGKMVNGGVGKPLFGARGSPFNACGGWLEAAGELRGMNRKPCARTSTGARSSSTADPTGPGQIQPKPPRKEKIGLSRPRIYSARCLLTFQIRYLTVAFQCACHPYGRLENHRQPLTNLF